MHQHISYLCAKRYSEILKNKTAVFLRQELMRNILLHKQNCVYLFSCQNEIPDCKKVQQQAKHALWSSKLVKNSNQTNLQSACLACCWTLLQSGILQFYFDQNNEVYGPHIQIPQYSICVNEIHNIMCVTNGSNKIINFLLYEFKLS